jgi:membrane-bound serine protease (ClpP class)
VAIPIWLYVIVGIAAAAFIALAAVLAVRTHRNRVTSGKEDLVGGTAVVLTPLEPKGIVLVEGERWTAILDKGTAAPDEEVTISKVAGLLLHVTRKTDQEGGT